MRYFKLESFVCRLSDQKIELTLHFRNREQSVSLFLKYFNER